MTDNKVKRAEASNNATEADKIWIEIKDKNIEIFALPDQKVSDYCNPVTVEPSKLYLLLKKASSALPAIESAIGNKFTVELANKYVIVSRTQN